MFFEKLINIYEKIKEEYSNINYYEQFITYYKYSNNSRTLTFLYFQASIILFINSIFPFIFEKSVNEINKIIYKKLDKLNLEKINKTQKENLIKNR